MKRRTFITAAASATAAGLAGCLEDSEVTAAESDDDHVDELRADVDDRGVAVHGVELADDVVTVEHGYEEPNDAVANVAMAFVDRVSAGWDVDRLEGYLGADGETDYAWHAEAAWAQSYADGDIGPDEYGQRISGTFTVVVDGDDQSA